MATSGSSSTPLTHSLILKSHIFRSYQKLLWHRKTSSTTTKYDTSVRLLRGITHLLPRIINLSPRFLSIGLCNLVSNPTFPTVFQPRIPHLRPPMSSSSLASATNDPTNDTKTVRVVVKGRVQGVFYRNWTVDNATELGLKGWVRNRRDGSVEALFSGSREKVQEMEQRCRRGPRAAMVTGLEVWPSSDDDDPGTGFERRPTV